MLKALELVGFKSFADKTRFEFPAGITVVVGPNGSGKSNIVDAIKWVLGEQSVKSLRGKEMADVIFNGSGSRKGMNSAEATLTFDNAQRLLAIDTPDVHITRRVYRSGEGEYLINRQPCRLRDIRDLFAGTGAATEAYSVIEQGKVDVLLQASPRDRRVIFEEAAGISRFKAKKLEATRRLERVEQNLLRLSDIVEEVESRLRSVRLQAAKARRYKEHTDRLQELRTQVGLHDWRKLSEDIGQIEADLEGLRRQAAEASASAEAAEARALQMEVELHESDEAIRGCEGRLARNRERIAAHESTIEHQRARCRDLEEEVARHRRHLAAMSTRAGDLEEQLRTTSAAAEQAEAEHARVGGSLAENERALAAANQQFEKLREAADARRSEQMTAMRAAATFSNQISALDAQLVASADTARQRRQQIDQLEQAGRQVHARLEKLRREQSELSDRVAALDGELQTGQAELASSRRDLLARQKELAQLEGRRTGAVERAAVLDELEKRLEGVSAGVKQVLAEARQNPSGPFAQVRGLVADLLQVGVEMAPVVEVALGSLAQHVVVARGGDLLDQLTSNTLRFQGRVGFLPLELEPAAYPSEKVDLSRFPGVIGRAEEFVQTSAEFQPLAQRLLGRTWIVEKIEHALQLARGPARGVSLVTLAGELVSADGNVVVGPRHASVGLISRRSELRELRSTISELERKISEHEQAIAGLERRVAQQDQRVHEVARQHKLASDALNEHRVAATAAEGDHAELQRRLDALNKDLAVAEAQQAAAATQLQRQREDLARTEAHLADLEATIHQARQELAAVEQQRSQVHQQVTDGRVQLAKSEQRLDSLRRQREQLSREGEERGRALSESRAQLAQGLQRSQEARRNILRAGGEVAELYLQKEQLAADVVRHIERREAIRHERSELAREAQHMRSRLRKVEEKIHARELSAGQLHHERSTLAQRLREDYQVELAELEHEPSAEELHEREAVEQEIEDLRRKINNIGNVNLDALAELEELETRYGSLSAQFDDLSKAKASLEQIIGRINADSRRLFAETLETVCGHFQTLFRKLFGGGQADIILEEGEDILESGIEIVARPPGKEPRSISLLSGGEKTLTCVALLLAIFRSRPSPFCVLDEVDAALDEANIERFVNVVKDFLAWTQFIVVTHSKKTMTCATTLYGVTMQESGISKRVSVRFEDVSEGGHIHHAAVEQSLAEQQDETQAA